MYILLSIFDHKEHLQGVKALLLQFTIGTVPFFVVTLVRYWAYENIVFPYLIIYQPFWTEVAILFALANVSVLGCKH